MITSSLALVGVPTGMIVGAAISGYDYIVNTFLWESFLRTLSPEALCLRPIAGMLLTGIILSLFRVSSRKAIPKLATSGIGAIFRAPLSGAIMGIESPYKRDLAHEALVHGLVASVVSYATFSFLRTSEPYFPIHFLYVLNVRDLLFCLPLGILAGMASHMFLGSLASIKQTWIHWAAPRIMKYLLAG